MVRDELVTPCYIINHQKFVENCHQVMDNFKLLWGNNIIFGYSIKTNNNPTLMKMAVELGWFPEAVSSDELKQAKNLGFKYPDMILNGPAKGELFEEACKNQAIVNLDNLDEVNDICELFNNKNQEKKNLRIGLRINFDLESVCPGETSAGIDVGRFGLSYENGDLERAIDILRENQINISGVHMHTSTKTRSIGVFTELAKMVCQVSKEFDLKLSYIDMGGGFFGGQKIEGKPDMKQYAEAICGILKTSFDSDKTTLILEPGVSVIATAVEYMTRVDNIRDIRGQKVVTLDGTLLHINPFMAKRNPAYEIFNQGINKIENQIVSGCTCMENDRFFVINNENELTKESHVLFKNAGAYTMGFNSHFIVCPPRVYVYDDVKREFYEADRVDK